MGTDFWLVRHGETDWNLEKRYQGSSDIPLNETGHKQAATLYEGLSQMSFDAVYASDLGRVRETVANALGSDEGVIFDARLRELSFGKFEGLTLEEIKEQYPDEFAAWDVSTFDNAPHGGENMNQISTRIKEAFDEIVANHEGQSVLIFAHGGVFGILMSMLLSCDIGKWWQFHFTNCSLSHLEKTSRGYVLHKLSDTTHMGELKTRESAVNS